MSDKTTWPVTLALLAGALLVICCFLAGPAPAVGVRPQSPGQLLEELRYQVDFWFFNDSIPAVVTLNRLTPGRYRAEITGQARGLLGVLSGNWQGRFTTEMVWEGGQFKPLLYREETHRRGKLSVMEYRFHYQDKRVELWRWDRRQRSMVKKWQTVLDRPMYDPISFYYNQRLNLKAAKEGDILRLPSIPYPKPEDVVLQVGPQTAEGRRVTIILDTDIVETEGKQIFALLDQDGVATRAWTRLLRFGKVSGTLLPGAKRLQLQEIMQAGGRPPGQAAPAAVAAATPAARTVWTPLASLEKNF
jgi:hypothetical protein